MTPIQLLAIASVAGAVLFFVAGAATTALRQRGRATATVDPSHAALSRHRDALAEDVARMHELDRTRSAELDRLRTSLAAAEAAAAHEAIRTSSELDALRGNSGDHARELTSLRNRLEQATREATGLRERAEAATRELGTARTRSDQATRELALARTRADQAEAGLLPLRATEQQLVGELERVRGELEAARSLTVELQATAANRAKQLATDLERSRHDAAAATSDIDQLHQLLEETQRQLAERNQAMRDLATEAEQLRGRVTDAEGLRADYVRLRTASTESEFLKSEVARLETELRNSRVDALGSQRQRRRAPRGSMRPATGGNRSIGESLTGVIEQFIDVGTRSTAVADTLGFPLAASGDDGLSLAAYAALLIEAANRASQFVPMSAPTSIEVVDEHGTRVSVWTFSVESDRLLLVNLAVSQPDAAQVETTLADLTAVLTPTAAAAGGYT